MTSKLDYLRWLGVDCLWLPPFYDSPRRDGGYDIRDYYQISPEHGSIENFVTFVDEAHARGIRVITDLVLNHTSDTHAWFQASRSDPNGPCGDFYVWRDTDTGYAGVRIVLCDTEHSNWTLDPVRQQYFWHRFFSHQPLGRHHLPVRAGRHQLREPAGDPRIPQAAAQGGRRRVPRAGAAGRGEPVAGRPGRRLRRPEHRGRRVPHGLPLPADAAHLHGRTQAVQVPDLGDHRADAGDPEQLPVGHVPAQPRRADPGDGHRRGTRLPVRRVRHRPAGAGQPRHPAPAGAAGGQRP